MALCLEITDVDWAVTKDVFAIVSVFVSCAGVLVALWVGVQGLATWRRQLRGSNDHELARRILLDIYMFRQLISSVRRKRISGSELLKHAEAVGKLPPEQRARASEVFAYSDRTASVQEFIAKLKVLAMEAEAVWDDELGRYIASLEKLSSEICNYIDMYYLLRDPDLDEDEHMAMQEYANGLRMGFSNPSSGSFDGIGNDISECFKLLENLLKAKMV